MKPTDLNQKRKELLLGKVNDALVTGLSEAYKNSLDYSISLFVNSMSSYNRELPNILDYLSKQKPSSGRIHLYNNKLFNNLIKGLSNLSKNIPFEFQYEFIKRNNLFDEIDFVSLDYCHNSPSLVINIKKPSEFIYRPEKITRKESFLYDDIIKNGFESAICPYKVNLFDCINGMPIIQGICNSIQNDEGHSIICMDHDSSYDNYDGVMFSPSEFSSLSMNEIFLISDTIEERLAKNHVKLVK